MPDFSDVQTVRIQYIAIAGCLLLIAGVLEAIRRGRLREEYAFIWLGSAIVALLMSIWRGAFDALARFLGIAYGPALLILVILVFGFVFLVHFSIVVSKLKDENKRLAQEMAILTRLVEERKTEDGNAPPTG
jgi:hypothetical protein